MRAGFAFLAAPIVTLLLVLLLWLVAPVLGFPALAFCYALLAVGQFGAIGISAWLSWRGSKALPTAPRVLWSRWYMLTALGAGSLLLIQLLAPASQHFYKSFYMPSGAMSPTLLTNDRIIASMRGPGVLRRGDIVIFRMPNAIYIKRVAALPGDTIAMTDGIVILNGARVAQRFEREDAFRGWMGSQRARRLSESFPGEPGPHDIYDQGDTPQDNFPAVRISPGHVFVLGDNRDDSADSRIERLQGGVEQLPITDIIGKPLYYSFGPSHRMGERVTPN